MDFHDEFNRLFSLLDNGLKELRTQSHAYAVAEADYRRAKAERWVQAPTGEKRGEWSAAQRAAWVDAETAELRQVRDIADGLRQAALEAVRARRTQVSALQSLLSAEKEEMAFSRTAPEYAP